MEKSCRALVLFPESPEPIASSSPSINPASGKRIFSVDRELLLVLRDIRVVEESRMHPHLTIHRHPMCAEIIEVFQKCHMDHPLGKFFGECTDLKIKLDKCFREEKAVKRKANFEESKKLKERLREYRMETSETREEEKRVA